MAALAARGMSALYQSDDNNNANNVQPDDKAKLAQNPLILIVEILSHLVSFFKRAGEIILPIEGHILSMVTYALKSPVFQTGSKRLTIAGSIAVVLDRKVASDSVFPISPTASFLGCKP